MDILEQGLRDSLNAHETGEKMYLGGDGNLYTQSQVDEENMTPFQGAEDQLNPESIAGEVIPMGVGEFGSAVGSTFAGALGGAAGATAGLLGDLIGLGEGLYAAATAEEGQKIDAFLDTFSARSEKIGSGKTIGVYEQMINESDLSPETKEKMLAGSKYVGEWAEIPGGIKAATALLRGARNVGRTIMEPGRAPAMAPQVPSAVNVDIEAGEKMLSTPAKRQDLKKLLDQGTPLEEIDNHPAVIEGVNEMLAIPKTDELPNYGMPEFWENRQYVLPDGTPILGREAAVDFLLDDARTFASREMRLKTPVPTKFERKAIVILGPPAAGKSTLANPIAVKYGATIIDGDEAKKIIPGFEGGVGAGAVHEESSAIIDAVKDLAIANGENVVFPKVGATPGSIRRLITELKEAGYNVDLMEMQVTPDEAMRRMYGRFASSGRLIPPDRARAVGDGPSRTFDTLVEEGIADGYTRIDNNPARGAPKPVIRDDRGVLEGTGIELFPVPSGRGSRNRKAGSRQENAGVSGNDKSPSEEKLPGVNPDITVTYPNGAPQ